MLQSPTAVTDINTGALLSITVPEYSSVVLTNKSNVSNPYAHNLYGDVITCANQKCKDCWNAVIPDEAEKEEV